MILDWEQLMYFRAPAILFISYQTYLDIASDLA